MTLRTPLLKTTNGHWKESHSPLKRLELLPLVGACPAHINHFLYKKNNRERPEHLWSQVMIPKKLRLKNRKCSLTLGKKKLIPWVFLAITMYKHFTKTKRPLILCNNFKKTPRFEKKQKKPMPLEKKIDPKGHLVITLWQKYENSKMPLR